MHGSNYSIMVARELLRKVAKDGTPVEIVYARIEIPEITFDFFLASQRSLIDLDALTVQNGITRRGPKYDEVLKWCIL